MHWKICFTGLCLLASIQFTYAWEEKQYSFYEITEDTYNGIYGPVIKVYTGTTTTPYYTIPIRIDSKLCEYIIARLINNHNGNNFHVGYKKDTYTGREYYRFTWNRSSLDHQTGNFGGIGFYEDEDKKALVLEVFEDVENEELKKEFYLSFSETDPLKKLKFDYIVAALVDYYALTPGTIKKPIEVITNGSNNIGIRIDH